MFIRRQAAPNCPPTVVPRPTRAAAKARFWIGTIASICAGALILASMIATLGTVAGAKSHSRSSSAQTSPQMQTYEGVVSDSHCGAKHSAAIALTATDCTILCVRQGEQFVLVNGDTTYLLEGDPTVLKPVAGRRTKIMGTMNTGRISVATVAAK